MTALKSQPNIHLTWGRAEKSVTREVLMIMMIQVTHSRSLNFFQLLQCISISISVVL